ncbi:hypothetical protein IV203_036349 [Nitzschia inconspicua]|uniref:Uncharacterized protein n=1 Tax=Nitzschia inconspicua TaxID=303405 RepID=A0A9K3LF13_9STRA|nr:hypothetical protein IV203_036349 [Nitzschia inconspicua]
MFRTALIPSPVITLLSPSVAASRRAAGVLSSVLSVSSDSSTSSPNVTYDLDTAGDDLDSVFASSVPGFSRSWKSIGVTCSASGTVIHFFSLGAVHSDADTKVDDKSFGKTTPFSLLSITEGAGYTASEALNSPEDLPLESIKHCRKLLANEFSQLSPATKHFRLNLKSIVGGRVTTSDLLRETVSSDGLPLLSIQSCSSNRNGSSKQHQVPFFKEIVVPCFDYAEYKDGSTIMSRLAMAETTRPAVGVYEWPGTSSCIRPLPTAAEDQRLPPPSLIFHSEPSHSNDPMHLASNGVRTARIGYSGGGINGGQTMILHPDLGGLDVRLCSRTTVSSSFAEAQDSLLAGSLEELQSTNVLLAGGEKAVDDHRSGKGDCWIELRANVKRPAGYLRAKKGGSVKQKIARIPDLPYE